jgi:hypothetical protein
MTQKMRIGLVCEFCNKEFANKQNVLRHQKTTCKKKSPVEEFRCKYCERVMSRKNSLERHIQTCPSKREYKLNKKILQLEASHLEKEKEWEREYKQIEKECKQLEKSVESLKQELKTKNKKFKKQLKEKDEAITELKIKCGSSKADGKVEVYDKVCAKVLDKSTNTNNIMNIHPKLANLPITTIHPLTEDYVKKRVANGEYTFDHYRRGENGIVDFINSITMCENDNGEIERSYVTTDASRDSFHRLVETKEWEKDKGGKFIDVIFDTLSDRVDKYQNQLLDERIKCKDGKTCGYDPEVLYKRNTDLHSGIVSGKGKQRQSLRKRIKKETSDKVAV